MEEHENVAALTIALSMAAGVLSQLVARHLSIPGIVVLLGVGVLLGPEVLNLVRPDSLDGALHTVVGFSVAVILFEGSMHLNLGRLRQEAKSIRRLVTLGGLITAVGGTLAARYFMEWDWSVSALFGTLVIVTGPTVITPLLRRIRVQRNVETVLEAEGILIDAIGALVAVVALEVALAPAVSPLTSGAAGLLQRLGAGLGIGLVGGFVIALLLRQRAVVPEGMRNILALALMLVVFQGSNALYSESGILAVVIAGMVVGNLRSSEHRDLIDFKEQLTLLLLGMLFVLLAADVSFDEVTALGVPGLLTVLALMFVVRPLNVLASTHGSQLKWREKAFLSWLAPRGIVAAAVASLFAQRMGAAELDGGNALRALVFLVIATTVLVQGLSGGLVARLLGVQRKGDAGFVILGASGIGLILGRALRGLGEEVVFIDLNADAARAAADEGFRVVYGSGLDERVVQRSEPASRKGYIGATVNESVNLLFAGLLRNELKVKNVWVAVHRRTSGVRTENVDAVGAHLLFGTPRDLDQWRVRAEHQDAIIEPWKLTRELQTPFTGPGDETRADSAERTTVYSLVLPLVAQRGGRALIIDERHHHREGDVAVFLLSRARLEEARTALTERGWEPEPPSELEEIPNIDAPEERPEPQRPEPQRADS